MCRSRFRYNIQETKSQSTMATKVNSCSVKFLTVCLPNGRELRKQLLFNVEQSDLSVSGTNTNKSFLAEMNEPSSRKRFSMDYGLDSKSPPLKQQRAGADRPDVYTTEEIVTLPVHSTDFKLPLHLLIKDKQVEVAKKKKKRLSSGKTCSCLR